MANRLDHPWSLLDHASDLIQIMAPDGQIIYANQAWRKVLGYQQAEVSTLSFFDLLQTDSRDRIQQILPSLQTSASNWEMEATLLAKNGHAILVKGRIFYNENDGSPEIWSLWQRAASLQAFPSPSQAPRHLSQTSFQQQQVQEALQQSEDRYRTVVAALQEGVVLLDGDGRICTCNPSAERILGLSAEQLNGLNFFDLSWNTLCQDGSPFLAEMHPALLTLRTGKPYSNVIMGIYKPDGGLAWVSVNSQPLFRSGETVPYGVVASFSDITARKQTEEALRRSERRYRAIVEDQTELVCRFLPDGILTFANEAYCRLLGISQEELVKHSYKMFLLALDKETKAQLTAAANPEKPVSWLEHQVILPNGEVRWQRWSNRAIFDDRGQCVEFQAVGQDITARKQLEQALTASEAKLSDILHNAGAAIVRFRLFADLRLQYEFYSHGSETVFGYSAEEFMQEDRLWLSCVHPDDFEEIILPAFNNHRYAEHLITIEYRFRQKDGSWRWISETSISKRDEEADCWVVTCVATDITNRKRTEEELQEISTALSNAVEGISRLDALGRYVKVNLAYASTLGYPPEELIGQPWQITVHPEDLDRLTTAYQQMVDTGKAEVEARGRRKDGTFFYKQIFLLAIYNEQKQVTGHYCFMKDISDRKQAELALRQSEARLQLITDSIPACISYIDSSQHYQFVNRTYGEWFGYQKEDILGCSVKAIIGTPAYRCAQQYIERVLSGETVTYEAELPYERGQSRWVSGVLVPDINAQRQVCGYYALITDISDRKRTEATLVQEVLWRKTLFDTSTDGIVVVDQAGNIIEANTSFARMLGYSLEEVTRLNISDFDVHWSQEELKQKIEQSDSCVGTFETCHRRKDGSVYYVEITSNPLTWDRKSVNLCICRDISDRKRAEAEILKALTKEKELNELKSHFVSMISHEFRTPLTTIQSATELLEHYDWSQTEKQERFQQIHIAVQHMTQLLEDVLLIGKVEAGKLNFTPSPIDLTAFCRQLLAETQLTTDRKYCLTFNSHGPTQKVWIDQKLLRQILTNLLSNAIKYSPNGGNIELGLNYGTDIIQLWVKDEGIGIPPEAREHLFEAFFRAKNVSTIQGTGLGLAIVKKCVELHQGTITLESEVDAGTTFIITLPKVTDYDDKKGAG